MPPNTPAFPSPLQTWNATEETALNTLLNRPDRHIEIWTGYHDPRAIHYAQSHGISPFFIPPAPTIKAKGQGQDSGEEGSGGRKRGYPDWLKPEPEPEPDQPQKQDQNRQPTVPNLDIFGRAIDFSPDLAYLRQCNRASNAATKLHFENDVSLGSGTSIWKSNYGSTPNSNSNSNSSPASEWVHCTRGTKLRTVREWRAFYLNLGHRVHTFLFEGYDEIGVPGTVTIEHAKREELQKDLYICEKLIDSFEALEELVVFEGLEGKKWDWKGGLRGQCAIRVKQERLVAELGGWCESVGVELAELLGII